MIAQSLGRWGISLIRSYGAKKILTTYLALLRIKCILMARIVNQPSYMNLFESDWFTLIVIFRRRLKGIRRGHITAFVSNLVWIWTYGY